MNENQELRSRQEGESPYDYCLYLIDQGRLKRAERWVERGRVEERALRKILGDQIEFVRRLRRALKKGAPDKAERFRHCLISPIARRDFKGQIETLRGQQSKDPHVEDAGEIELTEEETINIETNGSPQEIPVDPHDPQSIARGLLMKKLEDEAGKYSEQALDTVTGMIERTWLRERGGKHVLGVGRLDLLVVLECLSVSSGIPVTLDDLLSRLHRSKSQVRGSVRELQRNYLRGSGFALEGDIDKEGVRLISAPEKSIDAQE